MRSAATYRLGAIGRTTLGLVAGLALACVVCRRSNESADACAPCGGGFREDSARQARIAATWRAVAPELGREPTFDLTCLCFGSGESISVEGQGIYLPADWQLQEQTARAVHLAAHRRQPPWSASTRSSCDARVELALAREADAHALELDTRRALRVTTARYPFESEYFATPPARRRDWLRDYFAAHPQGDGVVPGFVDQYRARCQAEP